MIDIKKGDILTYSDGRPPKVVVKVFESEEE